MSGTTPPRGSEPGDEKKPGEQNPYAQPGGGATPRPDQPWASGPPPGEPPPAWSGSTGEMPPAEAPEPPNPILNAVKLMYVGAALSLLGLFFTLASRDAVRETLAEANPDSTESEIDSMVNVGVGVGIVVSLIAVGLWLWMAWANKKGRSWARIVATILGGLNILFTLFSLVGGGSGGFGALVNLITIVLAAVILWLLYRPESGQYYADVSRAKR